MYLQGGTMEGTIPGNRVDQFRARLKEGSVYMIEKFNLYDAKKSYRAVEIGRASCRERVCLYV